MSITSLNSFPLRRLPSIAWLVLFSIAIASHWRSVKSEDLLPQLCRDDCHLWNLAIKQKGGYALCPPNGTLELSMPGEKAQELHICVPDYPKPEYQLVYLSYFRTGDLGLQAALNRSKSSDFSGLYLYSNAGLVPTIAPFIVPERGDESDWVKPRRAKTILQSGDADMLEHFFEFHHSLEQTPDIEWSEDKRLIPYFGKQFSYALRTSDSPTVREVKRWHARVPILFAFYNPVEPNMSRLLVATTVTKPEEVFSHQFLIWTKPNRADPSWIPFDIRSPVAGGYLVIKFRYWGDTVGELYTFTVYNKKRDK